MLKAFKWHGPINISDTKSILLSTVSSMDLHTVHAVLILNTEIDFIKSYQNSTHFHG